MSIRVQQEIIGLRELEKALKELSGEMSRRGDTAPNLVKNALSYAARTSVKPRMQALAPKDTGRLANSIFHKLERSPRILSEVAYVGPRAGKSRDDPNGAWYAAIVNARGGAGGRGKGFMQRSIVPQEDVRVIAGNLGAGIERVAKKIGAANLQAVGSKAKKAFK